MSGKKYYWLKLKDDFFTSREIKKLRNVAGGDTYTIIYLKMQLLSIKNGGIISFEGTENDIIEQLSLELDEAIEDVRLTFAFLLNNKMLESLNDEEYLLSKVPELIGSETDAAERMRRMRDKKRNTVTPQLQDVTQRKREEIEKREKRKELDIEKDNTLCAKRTPYSQIMESFNSICTTLPPIKSIKGNRQNTVRIWYSQLKNGMADVEAFFKRVHDSDFLSGRNGRWHNCSFDWIIKAANRQKIEEGTYDNRSKSNSSGNVFYDIAKEMEEGDDDE